MVARVLGAVLASIPVSYASMLSACATAETSAGVARTDSADVAIIRVSGLKQTLGHWRIDSAPRLNLGDESGQTDLPFLFLAGVRSLPDRRLAVASDASKRVMVFDSLGRYVGLSGGNGKGPGEFLHLQVLTTSDSSIIALFDALQRRLTFVDARTLRSTMRPFVFPPRARVEPVHVFGDSSLLVFERSPRPAPTTDGVVRDSVRVVRFAPDGRAVASFGWHPGDERVVRRRAPYGLVGGDSPFQRRLHVAATDSLVHIAESGTHEIRTYSVNGSLRRIVRVSAGEVRVTRGMREAYRTRVKSLMTDDYTRWEWAMLSADDVFPEHLPAFDRVLVDRSGTLWMRDFRVPDQPVTVWTAFGADGNPLARLPLPADFAPSEVTDGLILGISKDSDGVERVRTYKIRR